MSDTKSLSAKGIDKAIDYAITGVAILMVLVHMYYSITRKLPAIVIVNAHIGFALTLVFLNFARKAEKSIGKYLLLLCVLISLICVVYVHIHYEGLQVRAWANTKPDLIIGVMMIVIVIIATKLGFGWFMPVLITVIMIYPFFGKYLPEPFTTRAYPIPQAIANYSIGLSTGLYSNNLRTSTEYIFLFVVFGSMLSATGVQTFFWELGKILFRNLRSGPGLMAVLNSALVGSVTGSAVANVMITGVYTIPSMKAAGYRPEDAAAMEAAASTGGQIMPPVMGIVAFVMASYTGIPYLRIVVMAIIPAVLYYLCVAVNAHFAVFKNQVDTATLKFFQEKVNYRVFFWKMPGFIIPLAAIVIILARGASVMGTAFWAILILLAISLIAPKDLRPKWKDFISGIVSGAKEGATLGVILCAVGIILISFSGSGLAVKIGTGIAKFSGGTMIGVLLLVWVMCILFGMIGVTSVAYYMAAAFAAPVLIKAGLPVESTHFFLMFPTVFAVVTPPVALACIVAAKLAGADYTKTCFSTIRAMFIGFFLPFLVVYSPSLMLMRSPREVVFWLEIFMAVVFVLTGQFAMTGYMFTDFIVVERIMLGISAVFAFLYSYDSFNMIFFGISLVFIAAFFFLHIPRYMRKKKAATA